MALSVKRDVYLDIMYHLFANPTISSANLGQSLEHTHTQWKLHVSYIRAQY